MKSIYIVAVSGGVDSVSLLHKLMNAQKSKDASLSAPSYIVAHFDHGIRQDSESDARFVEGLAKKYDLPFASKRVELGPGVSEETARDARYEYLRSVKDQFKAEAIVTGHHQDDVLETMIVNMLRGTGPRGLVGYTRPDIIRPYMNTTKQELLFYAKEHELEWREDSTNMDTAYLRNHVRINVLPSITEQQRARMLAIRSDVAEALIEIDSLSGKFLTSLGSTNRSLTPNQIYRPSFAPLPYTVQKQLLAHLLRMNGVEIDKKMIKKAVLAAKTLGIGKHVQLKKDVSLHSNRNSVLLKVAP